MRKVLRGLLALLVVAGGLFLPATGALARPGANAQYPAWAPTAGSSCRSSSGPTWFCYGGSSIASDLWISDNTVRVCAIVSNFKPTNVILWINMGVGTFQVSQDGSYCETLTGESGQYQTVTVEATADSSFQVVLTTGVLADPTSTPTDVPSAVPTNTPVNSPTRTPTAAPGFTPAATLTPVATGTSTPAPSSTPSSAEYDCGPAAYPVLNCSFLPSAWPSTMIPPNGWDVASSGADYVFSTASARPTGVSTGAYNWGGNTFLLYVQTAGTSSDYNEVHASQNVTALTAGTVYASISSRSDNGRPCFGSIDLSVDGGGHLVAVSSTSVSVGHVVAGATTFEMLGEDLNGNWGSCGNRGYGGGVLSLSFVSDAPWSPVPTATGTVVAGPSPTALAFPTETPVGFIDPAPSSGGCPFWNPLCNLGGILEGIFIPSCIACDLGPLAGAVGTVVPIRPSILGGLSSLVPNSTQACIPFGGSNIPLVAKYSSGTVTTVASVTFAPCAHPSIFGSTFFPSIRILITVVSLILFLFYVLRFIGRVLGRRAPLSGGSEGGAT